MRSSSRAACPDTCTGALRPWKTLAPRRTRRLITRDTAVSFPGIGVAEMRIVSSSSSLTYLCRSWAMSDRAANGSPWLPVVMRSWWSAGSRSSSSMSSRAWSGTSRTSSDIPTSVLRCMDRPKKAICLPAAIPASAICWIRWMWEAKQAAMTRPGASSMMSRIGSPRDRSDGTNPGTSAFVESASSRRTPRRPSSAKAGRSVGRPSIGVGSSLKSPECSTIPSGVSKATAAASGTEWLTGMNEKPNGPCLRHSPNATGWSWVVIPSSSMRPRASSSDSLVP